MNKISHIYMEETCGDYALTARLREQFADATLIPIKNYKNVFNRKHQSFANQKKNTKIIIAEKKDHFVYPYNPFLQSHGYGHSYYITPVMNCIYDCHYCYLGGMYDSANLVIFANQEDYLKELNAVYLRDDILHERGQLAISYDTDLLALESKLGLCRWWVEHTEHLKGLDIEIRSKAADVQSVCDLLKNKRIVWAWTLSPDFIVRRYEKGTPSLKQRLKAVRTALDAGARVRLCFDPLLYLPGAEDLYRNFIKEIFSSLPAEQIHDVSLGVFRMSADYFKRLKRQKRTDLVYYPFENKDHTITYPESQRESLICALRGELETFFTFEQINIWM